MGSGLVFYTHPMSRGRIARWMLEEVGAPYETVLITLGQPNDALRAINPMVKVPALVHRGRTVTETAAICAYLADSFPAARLAPSEAERADYYRWLFFTAGPVESALLDRALGLEVPPERQSSVGYGTFARMVDALEQAVSAHPYVAGDRFTAADVYVASLIESGTSFLGLPKREAFTPYLSRTWARPAAVRAREIDDTLIRNYAAALG
jgi:glutathione S-transferase